MVRKYYITATNTYYLYQPYVHQRFGKGIPNNRVESRWATTNKIIRIIVENCWYTLIKDKSAWYSPPYIT